MFVAIQHTISNPDGFWATADREAPDLPDGFTLHSAHPSPDGTLCNCLFEVESVELLQSYEDEKYGAFATNLCYEVDGKKGMGMPE